MTGKIPQDSFEWYVANDATYEVVAEHYGVSKRAVVAHAKRHGWTERLAKLREEARTRSDRKLAETLEEMNTRHLRSLRAVQGRTTITATARVQATSRACLRRPRIPSHKTQRGRNQRTTERVRMHIPKSTPAIASCPALRESERKNAYTAATSRKMKRVSL